MNVAQRKRFVSRELVALAAGQPQPFAALCEQQYHERIEAIAREVLASGRHIVMLTGASAAGKTTSAHKLAAAIAAQGRRSVVLSLDDFYAGAGRYPKNPDGSDDYESLQSLDLPILQRCLEELHRDGICQAPVFDFKIQQPNGVQTIDCRDGVVIIEGLHALNPALTEICPQMQCSVFMPVCGKSILPRTVTVVWLRGTSGWPGALCGISCSEGMAPLSRWDSGAMYATGRTGISNPTSRERICCWTQPIPTKSVCGIMCWMPCRRTRR